MKTKFANTNLVKFERRPMNFTFLKAYVSSCLKVKSLLDQKRSSINHLNCFLKKLNFIATLT